MLFKQELDIALEDKFEEYTDKEWDLINNMACGTIRLCLVNEGEGSVEEARGQVHDQGRRESSIFEEVVSFSILFKYFYS